MTILELAQQHRDTIIVAQSRPTFQNIPPVYQPTKPKTFWEYIKHEEIYQLPSHI